MFAVNEIERPLKSGAIRWSERLKEALAEAAAEDVSELDDGGLREGFASLQQAADMIAAQRLRRLAEVDRRRSFAPDGHLSTTSWLVGEFRVAGGEAAGAVRMARALEQMPATREALAAGEVTTSAVRVLVQTRDASPRAFARDEGSLVKTAREHTVEGLSRVVGSWRQRVDGEQTLRDWRRLRETRCLSVSRRSSGMVHIDGELDPETGERVVTALDSVIDADARSGGGSDGRTRPQRQVDALGEICSAFLDRSDRPAVGGERPHITVTVDVEALEGRAGGCELDHFGRIHPAVAQRLSCDAALVRVLTTGRSEPLDVGRRTPVVPAALRRAVVVRDRYCRFPGCDRPAGWCDCHHVVHWAKGGRTAISNLVLLCRRHHVHVHEQGFSLKMVAGHPIFRRPDGTVIADRAPP